MKDSGIEWIGKIPNSWKVERLQWHLDEVKELNDPIKTTKILSLTNKLGVIPYEEKGEQGNKAKEKLDDYKLAYPNTIVANSMNILIGSVGKCDYFGCVSPVYYVFKPKQGENIDYYNYIFQTSQFQKELRKYANGILEIRLRVSANNILKREVAIPSSSVQEKIVNYLNQKCKEIDELIKIENSQIKKLNEYKTNYIYEAITRGTNVLNKLAKYNLDYTKFKPKEWRVFKLKHIALLRTGSTPPTENKEFFDGGINWFTPGDFTQSEVSYSERTLSELAIQNGYQPFPTNSTLIIGIGGTAGKVAYMIKEGYSNQQITAIIPIKINHKYLFYLMSSLSKYIKDNAQYTTLPIINNSYLGNIKVAIPSVQEQINIVDDLDSKCVEVDNLIACKNQKIDELNEYKKSIIYEYVTGKRVL